MGLTKTLDLTTDFNTNDFVNVDISNWDYGVVQLETPTGTVTFNATNDGGAIQGQTQGNAETATNFQPVQLTNLATGTAVTSAAANGLYRFGVIGHYLQLAGSSNATKVLLYLFKIS